MKYVWDVINWSVLMDDGEGFEIALIVSEFVNN